MAKEPTPNPSLEGNNPCHPVTRLNKMKIPVHCTYFDILFEEMVASFAVEYMPRVARAQDKDTLSS